MLSLLQTPHLRNPIIYSANRGNCLYNTYHFTPDIYAWYFKSSYWHILISLNGDVLHHDMLNSATYILMLS